MFSTSISIHSLNKEWDSELAKTQALKETISIHSLNKEWDNAIANALNRTMIFQSTHSIKSETSKYRIKDINFLFQSTHSIKSETKVLSGCYSTLLISIHSLNKEWDKALVQLFDIVDLFQSTHSIKSETMMILSLILQQLKFQSTHSIKSETHSSILFHFRICISIHSLNKEWDGMMTACGKRVQIFQSTHSIKSETVG